MQSRERLLTPLLKYFVLALAQGILVILEHYISITVCCKLRVMQTIKLTCLQQSGPQVWPPLWKEVKGHLGSSESGIQSPLETGVCLPGTP